MSVVRRAYTRSVTALLRPYIRRELPGWGRLYRRFVGSFDKDHLWQNEPVRWVRGKLHGYEMALRISGWSNRATFFLGRFYDLPNQLLLQKLLRQGDTFVDIGANEGMMTLLAARQVGEDGQVLSFEPNPSPRAILEKNLRRNAIEHVQVHAMGLSDEPGKLELFVPAVNTGEGSFTPMEGVEGTSVTCPVHVGDEVLHDVKPKLIKIDVEGFEAHVLRGLQHTIERARPFITIEMIGGHLARDGSSPQTIAELFKDHGYVGHRLGTTKEAGERRLILRDCGPQLPDGDYLWAPAEREEELLKETV